MVGIVAATDCGLCAHGYSNARTCSTHCIICVYDDREEAKNVIGSEIT